MSIKSHGFKVVGGVAGGGSEEPPKPPETSKLSSEELDKFFSSIKAQNPSNIVVLIETELEMAIESYPKSFFAERGAVEWAFKTYSFDGTELLLA